MADEDVEDSAQTPGLTTANPDPNRPAPRGTQRSPSKSFKARFGPRELHRVALATLGWKHLPDGQPSPFSVPGVGSEADETCSSGERCGPPSNGLCFYCAANLTTARAARTLMPTAPVASTC